MKKLLLLFSFVLPITVFASSTQSELPLKKAQNDITDIQSIKRGAKLFVNYCINCHSAELIRYSRIAEDLGWSKQEVAEELIDGNTSKYILPMLSTLTEADGLKAYGVVPPDLSLSAKSKGVDYIYSYLGAFYIDSDDKIDNYAYPGTAMPPIFTGMQGLLRGVYRQQADGNLKIIDVVYADTDGTSIGNAMDHVDIAEREFKFNATMRDLVNFLDYISEPSQLERYNLGYKVLLYVFLLIVLGFFLKKAYWRNIK